MTVYCGLIADIIRIDRVIVFEELSLVDESHDFIV